MKTTEMEVTIGAVEGLSFRDRVALQVLPTFLDWQRSRMLAAARGLLPALGSEEAFREAATAAYEIAGLMDAERRRRVAPDAEDLGA